MGSRRALVLVMVSGLVGAWAEDARAKPSCGQGGPTGAGVGNAGAGSYNYSVPAGYTPQKAIPLLLALHGDEGKPDYIYSVFKGLQADSGGAFILVAPRAPFGGGSWYQATTSHEAFINAVITKLLASYNIDQDRVWVTGWSGGATFLSYYAFKRQDILGAVVFYLGGGGGGSYSPPPGSCKIACRWVVGTKDFLYSMAKSKHDAIKQAGHDVTWLDLPGVGHDFQKSTLPATWTWLQSKTLCATTTPGSCGPAPKPDAGAPTPQPDAGAPYPGVDSGVSPGLDGSPWAGDGGPGAPGADALLLQREGGPQLRTPGGAEGALLGGCALAGATRGPDAALVTLPLLLLLGRAWRASRRRRRRGAHRRA